MAKKPETIFKEKVQKFLKTLPNTWQVKIQQRVLRGIPDMLLCIKGQFVAMELKKSRDTEPDTLQGYYLDQITRAGGAALTVYPENWPQVMGILVKLATGQVVIKNRPDDLDEPLVKKH